MGGIVIDIQSGSSPPFTVNVYAQGTTTPVLYTYSFDSTGIKYLNDISSGNYDIQIIDDRGCEQWLYNTTSTTDRVDAFIFEVTVTDNETVTLPLSSGYIYNFTVDWGNQLTPTKEITSYSDADKSYQYPTGGTYRITIAGKCQSFAVNNTESIKPQITKVIRWGSAADFRQLNFYGCSNLTTLPGAEITGANSITTFANFMRDCTSYTTIDEKLFNLTTGVTTFASAFEGSAATGTLSGNLFNNNTSVTSFNSTFKNTDFTCVIPTGLFTNNTLATDFSSTFASTPFTGTVPSSLFTTCTEALLFTSTFQSTNITGVPDTIFNANTKATHFDSTFNTCLGLTTVFSNNLFRYNTKAVTFAACFAFCQYITDSLPSDMFKYNTGVTTFYYTFVNNYSLTGTIPEGLFSGCTEVTSFAYTFHCGGSVQYTLEGEIPVNLFRYNTKVTTFNHTFRYMGALTKAPNQLFRYNTLCTDFGSTFEACNALELERYVFSDTNSGSTITRFSGQTMNFSSTFAIGASALGANTRYAPELWDPTVYSMTSSSYSGCFSVNSGTNPYSNNASIPAGWK